MLRARVTRDGDCLVLTSPSDPVLGARIATIQVVSLKDDVQLDIRPFENPEAPWIIQGHRRQDDRGLPLDFELGPFNRSEADKVMRRLARQVGQSRRPWMAWIISGAVGITTAAAVLVLFSIYSVLHQPAMPRLPAALQAASMPTPAPAPTTAPPALPPEGGLRAYGIGPK